MITQMDAKIVIGAVSTSYLALIGVIYWTSRTKVNHKLCDTIQNHNKEEHQNIRKYIEDAEERSEQRHKELRQDLTEVKELIKNDR